MRVPSIASAVVLAALCTGVAQAQTNLINVTGVTLDGAAYNATTGTLTAKGGTVTGTLLGAPFTTAISSFSVSPVDPATNGGACSVLDLELAPIHIALLGLHVDTSAICLQVLAYDGQGLLGTLLCNITSGGGLAGLTDLLNSLTGLLTNVLNQGLNSSQHGGNGMVCTGHCEVLDLVLGPLDLKVPLLGVEVILDNCNNGPVEVCVSATRSEGVLGSILCGLTNNPLFLQNVTLANILQLVQRVLG